jgi:hypothetical protein
MDTMKANTQTLKGFVLGALLVIGLAWGLQLASAQLDDTTTTDTAVPGLNNMNMGQMMRHQNASPRGQMMSGMAGMPGMGRGGDQTERLTALAEALGLTVEEVAAAHTAVMADPNVTDHHAALAEALGITVEELQAAKDSIRQAQQALRLETLLAEGAITEEQAALMQAHQAVRSYLDVEAMEASQQAFWQAAIDEALAAGAITAEQAEALASMPMGQGMGMGGGRGHGNGNGNEGMPGMRGQGNANGHGRGQGRGQGQMMTP